jgi:hypothetical protein
MNNYKIQNLLNNKKYLERDIEKCNEKIFNFETKINTINNLFGSMEQVSLSQINHQIDIINELNLIKKELNIKLKNLDYINMIYEKLQKPRLAPIVSEIIQPAIVPVIQPMIVEPPIQQVEQVEQQVEQVEAENKTNEIFNALKYLQDQINDLIGRVTNLELKN